MLYLLDELRVSIDTIDYGGQKTLASKITIFGHLCRKLQNWVSQVVRCTRGRFFYHHQRRDIWCPIDGIRFSGHNLHARENSNQFGHLEQKLYSWGASVRRTSCHSTNMRFFFIDIWTKTKNVIPKNFRASRETRGAKFLKFPIAFSMVNQLIECQNCQNLQENNQRHTLPSVSLLEDEVQEAQYFVE